MPRENEQNTNLSQQPEYGEGTYVSPLGKIQRLQTPGQDSQPEQNPQAPQNPNGSIDPASQQPSQPYSVKKAASDYLGKINPVNRVKNKYDEAKQKYENVKEGFKDPRSAAKNALRSSLIKNEKVQKLLEAKEKYKKAKRNAKRAWKTSKRIIQLLRSIWFAVIGLIKFLISIKFILLILVIIIIVIIAFVSIFTFFEKMNPDWETLKEDMSDMLTGYKTQVDIDIDKASFCNAGGFFGESGDIFGRSVHRLYIQNIDELYGKVNKEGDFVKDGEVSTDPVKFLMQGVVKYIKEDGGLSGSQKDKLEKIEDRIDGYYIREEANELLRNEYREKETERTIEETSEYLLNEYQGILKRTGYVDELINEETAGMNEEQRRAYIKSEIKKDLEYYLKNERLGEYSFIHHIATFGLISDNQIKANEGYRQYIYDKSDAFYSKIKTMMEGSDEDYFMFNKHYYLAEMYSFSWNIQSDLVEISNIKDLIMAGTEDALSNFVAEWGWEKNYLKDSWVIVDFRDYGEYFLQNAGGFAGFAKKETIEDTINELYKMNQSCISREIKFSSCVEAGELSEGSDCDKFKKLATIFSKDKYEGKEENDDGEEKKWEVDTSLLHDDMDAFLAVYYTMEGNSFGGKIDCVLDKDIEKDCIEDVAEEMKSLDHSIAKWYQAIRGTDDSGEVESKKYYYNYSSFAVNLAKEDLGDEFLQNFETFQKCSKGDAYEDKECPDVVIPVTGGRIYNGAYYKDPGYGGTHYGVDFSCLSPGAIVGADVLAYRAGTVITVYDGFVDDRKTTGSKDGGGFGNSVYIDHGDGTVSIYGHMLKGVRDYVGENDFVEAGDVLGRVGSSGSSTGNHLHFEIRKGSTAVDPFGSQSPTTDEGDIEGVVHLPFVTSCS